MEEQINTADREMKQKAENVLKVISDNYRKLLSERLANELGLIDEAESTGNWAAAQHHSVLAEVYKSMLNGSLAVQAT
ncbi:MAG TPA: hypothetical protein VD736_10745 [Nitrososphaera sp.]|nr:hypothetical protein [Nitrososphaera sp.]